MIKTLLILPLWLLSPVNAEDVITNSHCGEIYDVMYEAVEEGLMTREDMMDVWSRCVERSLNS